MRSRVLNADASLHRIFEAYIQSEIDAATAEVDVADAAIKLVEARFANEDAPTLDGIARRLGLTERTLQRALKKSGTTFRSLVVRVKMDRAVHLMRTTSLSLAQIALAVGFANHAAFTRTFKATYGAAPSAFRVSRIEGPQSTSTISGSELTS